MYAIVTISSKKHLHVYDVEDDNNIIGAACLYSGQGQCAMPLQRAGRSFQSGQLRVKWTNRPTQRMLEALQQSEELAVAAIIAPIL